MSLSIEDDTRVPSESIARALGFLVGHALVAIVATPIVGISTVITLCLPKYYTKCHSALLIMFWSMEWRLLLLLISLRGDFSFIQQPIHTNIGYGFIYFVVVNLLDMLFALIPLLLFGGGAFIVSILIVIKPSTMNTVLGILCILVCIAGGLLSTRVIAYKLHVPFVVAMTQATALPEAPQTPVPGNHSDLAYSHLEDGNLNYNSNVSRLRVYSTKVHNMANWLSVYYLSTPNSVLPHYAVAPSTPSPHASTPKAPTLQPPTEIVPRALAPLVNPLVEPTRTDLDDEQFNFGTRTQLDDEPFNFGANSFSPTAPSDDELASRSSFIKQRDDYVAVQRPRRQSLSSSDEEDFQTLCDSILRHNSRRYDAISPLATPAARGHRSVPSSVTSIASDCVFRNPDKSPQFTAYAPRRVAMGTSFDLSIYCFQPNDVDDVQELAQSRDGSSRQITRSILSPLVKGALVTVSIDVPKGFRLLDMQHQTFSWEGSLEQVNFPIFCEVHSNLVKSPQTIIAKILSNDFAGVLQCTVVVGSASKRQQCDEEWYKLEPVCDSLEKLEPGYNEIPFEEIKMKRWIGAGYFGDAYLAQYQNQDVVVKTLRQSSQDVETLQHEAAVSSLFGQHPCIVPFIGACTNPSSPLAIVTKYMPLGSLSSVVAAPTADQIYPCDVRTNMLKDAANGLLHLHSNSFIHRDMAARNCLVDLDGQVKVGDFGLARRGQIVDTDTPIVGPLKWMAPESLQPPHVFSMASDVFSFAVTMWEVYSGEQPFRAENALQVAVRVCEGDRVPLQGKNIPPEHIQLMERCLGGNPDERPTMAEVYTHLCK
ncbi:kinase [Thraustotheca clavata]|uniref:Kinase n=1 Tax=Thraustotheca clavata TaxID=74557 RepID=A0A1V9ZYF7_9STRA|nr:kinase [Thraustotheca clavata]